MLKINLNHTNRFLLIYYSFWVSFIIFNFLYPIRAQLDDTKARNLVTLSWEPVPGVNRYQVKIFDDKQMLLLTQECDNSTFDWSGAKPGNYTYQVASMDALSRVGEFSPAAQIIIHKIQIQVDKPELKISKSSVDFLWKPNRYVDKYELKVETNTSPTDVLFSQTLTNETGISIPIETFKDELEFKWAIKVHLKNKQMLLFDGLKELPGRLPPIVLIGPKNLSTMEAKKTYKFSWKQSKTSSNYHLTIGKSKDLKEPIVTIQTNNLFYEVPDSFLLNHLEIYWNVVGDYKGRKIISKTHQFNIIKKDTPIVLIYPENNKVITPPEKMVLSWESQPDISNYLVTLSLAPNREGKILIKKETNINSISINTKPQKNSKTFYWKVSTTDEKRPLYSEDRAIILAATLPNEEEKKKEDEKKEEKDKKKFKKSSTLSTFYTMSKGTFKESVGSTSVNSNQDSPLTLGLSFGHKFKEQSSISTSLYISKLDGSVYNNKNISIPPEYGLNAYYNHTFNKFPIIPYLGLDHERFSTYNTDELPLGETLKTREHNITYLTLGAFKVFKLGRKNLLIKSSFSKSLLSSSSPESLTTNKTFSGYKFIFYVNMDISRRWSGHFLFKTHMLEGPTDLSITRFGIGVGYRIF